MATTEAEPMVEQAKADLAIVRRLEAAGFRAWPAASVQYDGAWQIRLTAGHPSRRLNSVNPLDPSDRGDIERRIEKAIRRFEAYGRPPVFRMTPLAPPELDAALAARGWPRADETIVFSAGIAELDLEDAPDQLPLRDIGRYVDASLKVHGRDASLKPGLTEVLNAVRPEKGLFLLEDGEGSPIASTLCVHDNDLAGIFELATRPEMRRRGHARTLLRTALRWARLRGAEKAWLQVEAANGAGVALYQSLGFGELYRYAYRQAGEP